MIRFAAFLTLTGCLCAADSLTDRQILDTVNNRATALEEITKAPVLMPSRVSLLCRPATMKEKAEEKGNPHLEKFSRFYADKAGRRAAEGREAVHPEGTLLIKEKLPALPDKTVDPNGKLVSGKQPELFTGMLKREKGYNPSCGDWEFFTVAGDAKKITSRGKLANCMECHQRFAESDFTSRNLVPERVLKPAADGAITLSAGDAMVYGSRVRCDAAKNALTSWSGKGDAAAWWMEVAKGRYAVEVLLAGSAQSAGTEVAIQLSFDVEGRALNKIALRVEDPGGATNFKSVSAGELEVGDNGVMVLKIMPASRPDAPGVDIRHILLRPVGETKAGP